jgi:photosystem II stability/assembly factor-like uncharacterized protein
MIGPRTTLSIAISLALCAPAFAQSESPKQGGEATPPQQAAPAAPAGVYPPPAKGAEAEKPKPYGALKYRSIGPAIGGRVDRVSGVPGDPNTFYLAAAQGGVWKSEDGGRNWKPVFDDQPNANMGSIAVAPSDPSVVYAATGEANVRGNVALGTGIFKSTDAGKSWKQVLKIRGQIGTLIVHPRNPDVAYAAVLGSPFGASKERGVYRTTDGGKSWQKVLYRDERTGASDVAFDPNSPRVLFAGLWQVKREPWNMTSGGAGSGLWRSDDGGDSWKQLTKDNGLPEGDWGKVGVAVARADSKRVYALIEAKDGGLYRSDDGGEKFEKVNGARVLRQRAWYYSSFTIDPNTVWIPQVPLLKTIDGGKTIQYVDGEHHGDNHDVWIDPNDTRRIIVGNDGGIDISYDGGKSWFSPPLPLAQFYNIDVDNRVPYHVGGTMQDWGTASGPAYVARDKGAPMIGDWYTVGGGEAGDFVYDPAEPGHIYAGEYSGYISHYQENTGNFRNISIYPRNTSGHGAIDSKYRFQWTAPIAPSPHDPKVLYHGAQMLLKTTDRGQHWTAISGDLTRNDRTKQTWAGGPITGDNTGVEHYDTIFSVAESPVSAGQIWVGTDDGLVQLTRDSGKSWSNVTPPKLPAWATVECIEPSRKDAGTAYVVVDARRLDDSRPYLFRTRDFGKSWEQLGKGLPADQHLFVLREDPVDPQILYVGAERGVFLSRDGGASFEDFRLNLPAVGVPDIEVKHDDLVLGTRRGIWVLDDLVGLRAFAPSVRSEPVHLFASRPAYRFRPDVRWDREGQSDEAPLGAVIEYWLKDKPKGELKLEVLDGSGAVIRTLSSVPKKAKYSKDDPDEPLGDEIKPELTKEQGLNRIVWDLRHEGAKRLESAKIDAGNPELGPMATPGTYTLRLTVDGRTATSTATIVRDPRSPVSDADLAQNVAFALKVRTELDRALGDIDALRAIRAQTEEIRKLVAPNAAAKELVAACDAVLKRVEAIELKLHNPKAEVVYDVLAGREGGAMTYSQLSPLFSDIQNSDYPPTQGQLEQMEETFGELAGLEKQIAQLRDVELAKLEAQADALKLPHVIVPAR